MTQESIQVSTDSVFKALQETASANPTARAVFEDFAGRERYKRLIDLRGFWIKLTRESFDVNLDHFMAVFKFFKDHGYGDFVYKKGVEVPQKFIFDYDIKTLGKGGIVGHKVGLPVRLSGVGRRRKANGDAVAPIPQAPAPVAQEAKPKFNRSEVMKQRWASGQMRKHANKRTASKDTHHGKLDSNLVQEVVHLKEQIEQLLKKVS